MLSILDPRMWLAVLLWSVAVAFGGYHHGSASQQQADAVAEQHRTLAALDAQHRLDLDTLNRERALHAQDRTAFDLYRKEQTDAKAQTDRVLAGLRADVVRLRVPIVIRTPAPSPGAELPAASGRPAPDGYAELSPDAAGFVVGLLDRGDSAIRKHAAIVAAYERLRQSCNERSSPPTLTNDPK